VDHIFDLSDVLGDEHKQLVARRTKLALLLDTGQPPTEPCPPDERGKIAYRRKEAHRLRPFGVCLSGGGIRSATFNLGILQGLTERGLLPLIDILSTVSGGGYIGTWLHGVIQRKGVGDPGHAKVTDLISPNKNKGTPREPEDASADPVTFLRKYSNYLAPRLGLFSPDCWIIAIIWIRNMLLNQLILVPFLAGLVLMAVHAGFAQQWSANTHWLGWTGIGALCIVSLGLAVLIMSGNLKGIIHREFSQHESRETSVFENTRVIWICVLSVLVSALVIGTSSYDPIPEGLTDSASWSGIPILLAALWVLFLALQVLGGFAESFRRQHARFGMLWVLHVLWIPAACAAVTTVLVSLALHWIRTWHGGPAGAWPTIAWAPPLVVLALMVGVTIQIGLMGADFPDSTREWLSRLGALLSICCSAWMGLFAIAVFGPKWFSSFALSYGKTAVGLLGGWIATTAGGVLAGKSPSTGTAAGDPGKSNMALEWIGKIAPTVFLIGYLLTISFVVHVIIACQANVYATPKPPGSSSAAKPGSGAKVDISMPAGSSPGNATLHLEVDTNSHPVPGWLAWLQPIDKQYWKAYQLKTKKSWENEPAVWGPWPTAPLLWLGCGLLVGILPLRININEFSLHHFYKNRLVRCYLGAGRAQHRRPNPFTGFDHNDDLRIAELRPEIPGKWKEKLQPYLGPYPIINTTLNLNAGEELATQERKGASFIFSALYCGFDPPHSVRDTGHSSGLIKGYRDTRKYMYAPTENFFGGPAIGTAMGISGAAANPDGGYHTSAPLAFLMTIFDVRLGWWVGNPKRDGPSGRPGPLYALVSLLSELFAQTDWHSNYLNLSDGGHFENLGLYELVKRRCRYIIVCDGEEDHDLNFESLGGAIRKCRADFGVEIDLDPKMIHAEAKPSRMHCVVGTVTYPEAAATDDNTDPCGGQAKPSVGPVQGWILYLKASLTGDEPEDVMQYHATHAIFPHEPTANQFFTESQFESYRRLGLHVVESVFEGVEQDLLKLQTGKTHDNLTTLFRKLCQQWYPPTTVADGVSTRHTQAYAELMKRLSDDSELTYLDQQIIPRMEKDGPNTTPDDENIRRKAKFFCMDLMQLMENVWADLHLYDRADRENPKNGGWMRIFQYWAAQPIFEDTWKDTRPTYNDLFQKFYEELKKTQ
jgi:hypothetical protein